VQQNKAGGLTEQDVSLLQSVANQVAIALQNARQVEQTQKALTELGQSENRFRSVYDGSNDAIMLLDDNGFFDCNEQALKLFGFERKEDFLKVMPAEISPPLQPDGRDSEEAANENMQIAYEKGFNRFEWVHRRANREDFPAEVLLSAFTLSGKQVLQATVRDFTERLYAQVELRRQAEELSKVAAIATTVSTILEPETLLEQVSDLTKTAFNLYHAHVYVMNADGDMLELAAGAGEVGREMVAQGRLIPLDSERSLVARAARQRQGVIVNDVQAEPDFLSNPLLPETASEMAVPLIVGDQCLGVMDVQSERVNRFSPTDVAIQTTLASQVAVALQNARQYEQARQSEQLVRTLIDNLPDCIFVKDSKSRWILNNKAHLAMLGFETQEQVLGKSDLDIFPIELAQKYYDDEQELLRRKEPLINYQESVIHQTTGQRLSILTSKIPILDEHGNITALVGINHDITEREQLERETQERLAEIDSLYRAMSRQAWDTFQRTTKSQTSFYYDRSQPTTAAPAPDQWLEVTKQAIDRKESPQTPVSGQPVWAAPLLLRGDPIGAMAVEVDEQHPLTDEEKDLLAEMSDQIALAVESARLFEQTRTTLAETEMLYGIIAEMNAAQGYDDILKAMSERTSLRRADLLLLGIFDQPLRGEEQLPEWIYPVAVRGAEKVEIAQKYPVGAFQAIPNTLFTDQPVMVSDVGGDRRLDSVARTLFKEVFHASGMLILPLRLADQSIGFVMGFFCETSQIAPEDLQPLLAVTGQAAIAVQSRLLLERSQAHARQEQRIREVSAQVFGAADVDTIMRRAVQQIGRVLGMPAYIYLGQAPDSSTTE
jgi:PAS domain S-box-containing protein